MNTFQNFESSPSAPLFSLIHKKQPPQIRSRRVGKLTMIGMFGYSNATLGILIGMVITGAARSVAVKILYQSGFEDPLCVTLLCLLGQSLSLAVYGCRQCLLTSGSSILVKGKQNSMTDEEETEEPSVDDDTPSSGQPSSIVVGSSPSASSFRTDSQPKGSFHGFTDFESSRGPAWIQRMPYSAKLLMPSVCNVFKSLLRWASFMCIAASVGEMMTSGLELALSVLAARFIRQRMVSSRRWMGIGVVAIGIVVIGLADILLLSGSSPQVDDDESHQTSSSAGTNHRRDSIIGIALIIGQCILSVLQGTAEAILMQTASFPPTLLLGLEGVFGFAVCFVLFFVCGPTFGGKGPAETLEDLQEDKVFLTAYSICLTLLFTIAGFYNIKATEVTSSMTRDVWKNLQTVLVWIIGLVIFYAGVGGGLGEEFVIPGSLVILAGFLLMFFGIYICYSQKASEGNVQVVGVMGEDDGDDCSSFDGESNEKELEYEMEIDV